MKPGTSIYATADEIRAEMETFGTYPYTMLCGKVLKLNRVSMAQVFRIFEGFGIEMKMGDNTDLGDLAKKIFERMDEIQRDLIPAIVAEPKVVDDTGGAVVIPEGALGLSQMHPIEREALIMEILQSSTGRRGASRAASFPVNGPRAGGGADGEGVQRPPKPVPPPSY